MQPNSLLRRLGLRTWLALNISWNINNIIHLAASNSWCELCDSIESLSCKNWKGRSILKIYSICFMRSCKQSYDQSELHLCNHSREEKEMWVKQPNQREVNWHKFATGAPIQHIQCHGCRCHNITTAATASHVQWIPWTTKGNRKEFD